MDSEREASDGTKTSYGRANYFKTSNCGSGNGERSIDRPSPLCANIGETTLKFFIKLVVQNPFTILWIAIPLFIQTVLIFAIGYGLSKLVGLSYENAAPTAMIGASNHFEVAIATAAMLYGLSSGAALATVVGVLIEVPLMLMLVKFCVRTQGWFPHDSEKDIANN